MAERLAPYYKELGLDASAPVTAANRAPFDAAMCDVVEELKPEVVSFHFGLPDRALLDRVKATGAIVIGCATICARRSGWRKTAPMRSSRRARRRAAIAACS